MSQEKYIGMDVRQATISVAVVDSRGKLIMECILETKAATILEFIQGLRGTLAVDKSSELVHGSPQGTEDEHPLIQSRGEFPCRCQYQFTAVSRKCLLPPTARLW